MADIINLDAIDFDEPSKEVSFGGGIELMMNDKAKTSKTNTSGKIESLDIDNLENELNALSGRNSAAPNEGSSSFAKPISLDFEEPKTETKPEEKKGLFSSFLYGGSNKPAEIKKMDVEQTNPLIDENIRIDNINSSFKNARTNDDFSTFNDIPINPEQSKPQKELSREEKLRKKFELLRKFEALEKKGVSLSKKYTMDSSLEEMEGEYEMLVNEREKKNSVKFQGKVMMALLTGIEFLNNRFDPFDLKLDGWAESVNENIEDYDEIFEELHEKYRSKAQMAPELKLLFQLGGSAVMLHMTNTMFKSAMPGMDDIMRQNPQLAQQFQQAAVNSMGQQNPGFGKFMGDMMSQQGPPPPKETSVSGRYGAHSSSGPRPEVNPSGQGPPPPMKTASTTKRFNNSVDMDSNFGNAKTSRPEMKGPSNIDDLLSKIKSKPNMSSMIGASQQSRPKSSHLESTKEMKSVSVNHKTPVERSSRPSKTPRSRVGRSAKSRGDNNSTISIDELMAISKDADNMPKKSRRKPRSEKNTVSLDI
jgi:hypothetical protein